MTSPPGGQLYAAVIIYVSTSPSADYTPLYEESITLVYADSSEQATARAHELALSNSVSYHNQYGEEITWSLQVVVDVKPVDTEIGDGAEIYSRHFRDYAAYCAFEPLLSDEGGL